jgi:Mn-dependent transcriptional regulator
MKETPERFLETLYVLSKKGEEAVKSVEVGKSLGLNRPDVFRSLKAIKSFGYIDQKPYGKIILTAKGREKAERIIKIHEALGWLLKEYLGLPEEESECAAYKVEHIISDAAANKMLEKIDEYKEWKKDK